MLHICLVEDNQKLGDMLQQQLVDEGFICDWYTSVESIDTDKSSRYHIFLLDVMLEGINGFDYAKKLRAESRVGIIFLTAKSSVSSKREGFDAGADDYITKPFKSEELIFRIRALAERLSPTHYFKLGDVLIDWKGRSAKKGDELIHLTPIEREVVGCLLRNRGVVCWRADLIEYVWGTNEMYGMNRSLDVAVVNIRKKLGKDFIVTLPGVGYQLGTSLT